VSELRELQGTEALGDYDISLEMVVRSSLDWQGRLAEFQPELTMDRSYEYLRGIVADDGTFLGRGFRIGSFFRLIFLCAVWRYWRMVMRREFGHQRRRDGLRVWRRIGSG
jgi:hypothetical protein